MDKDRRLHLKSRSAATPSHHVTRVAEEEARSQKKSRGRTRSRSPHTRRASHRRTRSRSARGRRSGFRENRSQSRGRTLSRSPYVHRTRHRRSRSRHPRGRSSRSTSKRLRSREHLRHHNSKDRRESPPARSRSRSSTRGVPHNHKSSNNINNDVQNLFFKKFLDVMQNLKSTDDSDKFPVLNVLPEFDPLNKEQSVNIWINKVDECAQIYRWSDRQVVHYALPKLGGIAKTWYQGLPSLLHSWTEWKVKLQESFPTRENYAELLSEMLNKRVRFGEPLDLYFYSKINLLNRCDITGKRAVDCLLAGIDDRNVRVGGQSAEFSEPEQVLKFLKSIKVGQDKGAVDNVRNRDRRNNNQSNNDKTNDKTANYSQETSTNMTCYNCNEKGHPFYQCPKPKLHCTNCKLLGHSTADCPKSKQGTTTVE